MAVSVCLAACQSTTVVDPYYRPSGATIEQAYLSPGADFGNYSKLMAHPLEIYYPDNVPPPDEADLARLRGIFRTAFLEEIGPDYEIVTAAGPDVMLVSAQIIDLKVVGAEGTYVPTGRLRDLVTRGQLTLLMEFRDSQTDRVLARVGDTEQGQTTASTSAEASWAEVEAAARRWAGLFRRFLDENFRS